MPCCAVLCGWQMGLGKTAQSTAALQALREVGRLAGPFLIVAPLTTLGHWCGAQAAISQAAISQAAISQAAISHSRGLSCSIAHSAHADLA